MVLKVLAVYHLLHFSYQLLSEYYITPVPLIQTYLSGVPMAHCDRPMGPNASSAVVY